MRARPLGRPEGRVSAAACLALGVSLLACGGGGSGAATTQATGGGVTSTSTGSGNGSAPDSGTASGAAGTGGAVDASAGSGGTGTATQGGGAAGGDTTGPGSASTGGGTTGGGAQVSSRCAALLPTTPGQPVVTDPFTWPTGCGGATSAPWGDVALELTDGLHAPPIPASALFTADGARLGTAGGAFPGAAYFHPTTDGYQGIGAGGGTLICAGWDRTGVRTSIACGGSPVTSAPTPDGGSVFVVRPAAGGDQLLVWTRPDGSISATTSLGGSASSVLATWQTAHVVAVDFSGAPQARWFDATGAPLTPWFPVAVPNTSAVSGGSLKLLVDGTVALFAGGAWTALLRDGVASTEDPPAWLAALPTGIATIRGGNGYAVLPGGGTIGGQVASLEILTTDGESCGTVTLPVDSVNRLAVGWDGTVIVSEALPTLPTAPAPRCRFAWWPALLR